MCLSGLIASKSGSKPRSPRSFPRRGNISSLQNYVIVKCIYVKNIVGRDRRANLVILQCFVCWWEDGRVVGWEGKVGG